MKKEQMTKARLSQIKSRLPSDVADLLSMLDEAARLLRNVTTFREDSREGREATNAAEEFLKRLEGA